MSNIIFTCPNCSGLLTATFAEEAVPMTCPQCQSPRQLPKPDLRGGYLQKCMACPSTELFVRKDFPQRLGVAIVITGFVISSIFWGYRQVNWSFAVLLITALIDVVLYLTMGNVLECYRCHAQYRGLPGFDDYDQFDMESYEKHRQQALRLQEAQREQAVRDELARTVSNTRSE